MSDLGLPGHLEIHLGEIKEGWKFKYFQVALYSKPMFGGKALSTLGLSRYGLKSPVSEMTIRHELLMILPPESVKAKQAASLLQRVGEQAVNQQVPLLRGDIIGSQGAVLPRTGMTGLYVAAPVYLPDEFASYPSRDGEVVIAWLIPVYPSEARFVRENGWKAFEDRLVDVDPDLVNMQRDPIL